MDYTLKVANSSGSSNQEVLDELSKTTKVLLREENATLLMMKSLRQNI